MSLPATKKTCYSETLLQEQFPSEKFIDNTVWERLLRATNVTLELGQDQPRVTQTTLEKLQRLSAMTEGGAGLTFLKMPGGLTADILYKLLRATKDGTPTQILTGPHEDKALKYECVKAPCTIAITNAPLIGSHSLNLRQKQARLQELEFKMIDALSAMTHLALTCFNSSREAPTQLYSFPAQTVCSTTIEDEGNNDWNITVGFDALGNIYTGISNPYWGKDSCGAMMVLDEVQE